MRKTMIFAAVAALISLASCQKEGPIESVGSKNASPVFTASIAGATKTTVNVTDGKIAWEATDEITVTDASYASAVYTIESIDAITGKATFAMKDGETALGEGPYTATYGTAPATAQTYSETAGKLYMTAPATSDNSFTFTVQCGLMKLNLTKTGESVKSITVTGTPTGGSETTYTLTCDPAQSIASAKDFYISLPQGAYTKIVITDSRGWVCTKTTKSTALEVLTNHIKPVTFGETKINFVPALPAGALPGVFSVSDTKKVYFSKGNLWVDGSNALHFESNQYSSASSWDASHVSHFTWSDNITSAVSGSNSGDNLFCDESHKVSVDGGNAIYYALSTAEWQYLFNYGDYTSEVRNGKYKWATVNGVNGYVIAPDDFSGKLAKTYADDAELADNSLVFLPAAGFRNGSNVYYNDGDFGNYWSSTAYDGSRACRVHFDSCDVNPDNNEYRDDGYSVRLITECQ